MLGGESAIASKVAPLFEAANPTAAIYCKTGECEIRVTAREATEQAAEAACNARIAEFKEILGAAAYDVDVPALEYTVVRALREHGLHAATAESCTGGMIAERLTNVPGSSEVFGFGFVTYAEAAKQKLLGVDAAAIEKYNVVSGLWPLPWPLVLRGNPARSWLWASPAWPAPAVRCPASRWARSIWLVPTPARTRGI